MRRSNVPFSSERHFKSLRTVAGALCAGFLLLLPLQSQALDAIEYDARLCTAGIVVLDADLDLLLDPLTPENQKLWLAKRNAGMLGTLAWLCRRYATLHELNATEVQDSIALLNSSFDKKDWPGTRQQLSLLAQQIPLDTTGLRPGDASEDAINEAGKVYSAYCAGCHMKASPAAAPPVFALSDMARRQPEREFIARMILGVHGTPEIALQNPLSQRDISGMSAYLRACEDICR